MSKQNLEEMLHNAAWTGQTPGLERIAALLDRLDNPQNRLKFVHIAGTNGKGSTAAMISSVLTAAGYRTGLYTSPHLLRLNERFQIDGQEISNQDLNQILNQVIAVAGEIQPTEFDLMTALGLCYFAQEGCDIVVLEVGLGGRLDATNIIPPPEVAVVANIGLDHTAILGDSLAEIAREKAGILKSGTHAVLYHQENAVMEIVSAICHEKNIPLKITQPDKCQILKYKTDGQKFLYQNQQYEISLLGEHQILNALAVLDSIQILQNRGWQIAESAIKKGLKQAKWPGRLEILSRNPDFIVDGGHNPQCLQALTESMKKLYPQKKFIFLMGILADKNTAEMISLISPLAKQVIAITPDSPRALSACDLAEAFRNRNISATATDSVAEGIALAYQLAESEDIICALGSLYIVGEIRGLVK